MSFIYAYHMDRSISGLLSLGLLLLLLFFLIQDNFAQDFSLLVWGAVLYIIEYLPLIPCLYLQDARSILWTWQSKFSPNMLNFLWRTKFPPVKNHWSVYTWLYLHLSVSIFVLGTRTWLWFKNISFYILEIKEWEVM